MGIFGWLLYLVGAFVIFLFLHFLEYRYSITKKEKLVFSIIIWLFVNAFCFYLAIPYTSDIFLMFVFLMVIDMFYHSYFMDDDFFDREDNNIFYYILLVFIGLFVNQEFINQVNSIFLTGEELRMVLWFLIILFVYHFVQEKNILSSRVSSKKHMSSENILLQYTKLRYRYHDVVKASNKDLTTLIYSLMIFHNHQRTKFFRSYDYFLFRMTGASRKLGIMQIESNHFITDSDSIQMVCEDLEKIYTKHRSLRGKKRIEAVMEEYCGEDLSDIQHIFDIIQKF